MPIVDTVNRVLFEGQPARERDRRADGARAPSGGGLMKATEPVRNSSPSATSAR